MYLASRSKLFCACPAAFLAAPTPNVHVCPVCTGQPGAKPMGANRAAVEAAVRIARALGCHVEPAARVLRKHYFYPDLPTGYQRTSEPVGAGGALLGVRIRELHVEEDPGAYDPATGLVDYNRAGAPLVEIVTDPDFEDAAHARRFLGELRLVLSYLGVVREEAGIKADVNVSVAGGERIETKNVHSVRSVERVVAHEIERQSALVASGATLHRETRHWDEAAGRTVRLRAKESEADYRFIADPDVPPLDLAAVDARLPPEEAPLERRARLALLAGVDVDGASALVEERSLADAYEGAIAAGVPARLAHDFMVRDLRGELGYRSQSFSQSRVDGAALAQLLLALAAGRVTPLAARDLLRKGLDHGGLASLVEQETRAARPHGDAVLDAARAALADNPKALADYRAGKTSAAKFLVGQTMKRLQGRATPDDVQRAVERALGEASPEG